MSEVDGRKESARLVKVNLQQNSRRREVVAQCFISVVKIPRAELGYNGLSGGVKGTDKIENK
jgi:hypothetical protein